VLSLIADMLTLFVQFIGMGFHGVPNAIHVLCNAVIVFLK